MIAERDVKWVAAIGCPGEGPVIASQWPPMLLLFVQRLLARVGASDDVQNRCGGILFRKSLETTVRTMNPQLVNLHNLHVASDFTLLTSLPKTIPLVWTLHDMWPLTGYCCYSYDCEKFIYGCSGDCPQAGHWGAARVSPEREWMHRQRFYNRNRSRLVFVSPSRWLAEAARRKLGSDFRVEHIPYGLPLDTFRPLGASKASLRRILRLPEDDFIVLCGAHYVDDERKGSKQLAAAVNLLRSRMARPVTVVAFGNMPKGLVGTNAWRYTGTIAEERFLNLYYNAADVFAAPSLADNLPNTLIEATAAGTPSVTYNVGGCPEVVRDGLTGYVARYGDIEHLAECLARLATMTEPECLQMAHACRRVAEQEYDSEFQARRYNSIFQGLLDGHPEHAGLLPSK